MRTHARAVTTSSDAGQARQRDLQAMLLERQREMQHVLQHRVREAPSDGHAGGRDDIEHAEADIQEHIEVALLQMKGDTLQRVRVALARLESGDYGRCEECDGEISEKRLKALPFAVRCTPCEQRHEQQTVRERRSFMSFELLSER